MSTVAPHTDGSPSSAITIPNGIGFTSGNNTTTTGIAVAAYCTGYNTSGGAPNTSLMGMYGSDKGQFSTQGNATSTPAVIVATSASGSSAYNITFTAGTHFPANARACLVNFIFEATAGSPGIYAGGAGGYDFLSPVGEVITGFRSVPTSVIGISASVYAVEGSFWLEIPTPFPNNTGGSCQIKLSFGGDTFVSSATSVTVIGWRF
jgi:hypothetical protein